MHAQLVAAILALAGSAFGEASSSKHSTSIVTLFTPGPSHSTTAASPSCTFCSNHPHPKDTDRNWGPDTVLKDTTKHHRSFKLFAYPKEADNELVTRSPLHLVVHESASKDDLWALHLGSLPDDAPTTIQPSWNLHDGSLQTDGSAPINDTLYFRLFDSKYPKDTEFWTGSVFRDVSTKHQNQKRFKNEKGAKLEAKEGWSLVRDGDNAKAYLLKGSKPAGDFFACYEVEDIENFPDAMLETEQNPKDILKDFLTNIGSSHLVYSAEEHLKEGFALSTKTPGVKKGCMPLTIKVRYHQPPCSVDSSTLTNNSQAEEWDMP
jgi:hypothetical protein